MHNGRFVITGTISNTRLTKTIQTPCVDLSGLVDSERMESATANVHDIFGETEFPRLQAIQPVTLDNTTSQLILLTRPPRKDSTSVIQSEHMVVPTGQVFDLLQRRDKGRSRLDLMAGIETQNAIVTLETVSVT